ncbi:hypothetical protein IWQ62_000589 [Dispira parvispora]|uniref:Uncharacterized protein n=1 Tax=Dispira parvispora TaxID=1520584 RepID=A0A9W8AZS1_9FUNG|nr:hypothetical protein IWQ62_000589 [Dispira parvispora]
MQQLEFMIEFGSWLAVVFFLYALCYLVVDIDYLSGLSYVGSSFIASHLFGFLGWFTTTLLVPLVVLLMFPRPYVTLLIMLTLITDESIGLDPALHLMNPQTQSVDYMSTVIEEAITTRARSYRDSIGYSAFTQANGILPLDDATRKQMLNDSLHQLTTHGVGPMDTLHSRASIYTRSSMASSLGARLRYSILSQASHFNYSTESLNRSNSQFSGRYNVPATPHSTHGDLPPVPPLPVIQRAITNSSGQLDSSLAPSLSVPSTPGFEEVSKNLQSMPELSPPACRKTSLTTSPNIYRSNTLLSNGLNDSQVPANGATKKSTQCGKSILDRSLSVLTGTIPTISLTELNQDDRRTTSRKSLGRKLTNLSSKKSVKVPKGSKNPDSIKSKDRTNDNPVKRTRNFKKLPALPPTSTFVDEATTPVPLWTRTTPPSPAAGLKAFHRRTTSFSTASPGVTTSTKSQGELASTACQGTPGAIMYPGLPPLSMKQTGPLRPLKTTPPGPRAGFPNKVLIPKLPDPQSFPPPPSTKTPLTAGLPPPLSAFMSSSGSASLRPPSPVYCPTRTTGSEYNMFGDNYSPMKTSTFADRQTDVPGWQTPSPVGLPIKSVKSLPLVKSLPSIARSQTAALPCNTSHDTLVGGQSSPIEKDAVQPDEKTSLHTNLQTILLPQYPLTRSTNQGTSQLFELRLPTPTFGKDNSTSPVVGQSLKQLNPQDCLRRKASATSLPKDDGVGRFEQVRNFFRNKRKGTSLPPRQKLGEPTTNLNDSSSPSADQYLEYPGGVGFAKRVYGRSSQPIHYQRKLGSACGSTTPSTTSSRIPSYSAASFLPNPVEESVSLLEFMPSLLSTYSPDSSFDYEGSDHVSRKGSIKRKRRLSPLGPFESPSHFDSSDHDEFDYRVKFSPNPSRGRMIHVLPPSDQHMQVRTYSTLTSPPSYASTLQKSSFHRPQTVSMYPKDMTFRLSYRDSLRRKEYMNSSEEMYHSSFDDMSRFYCHPRFSPNSSRTPSSHSSVSSPSEYSIINGYTVVPTAAYSKQISRLSKSNHTPFTLSVENGRLLPSTLPLDNEALQGHSSASSVHSRHLSSMSRSSSSNPAVCPVKTLKELDLADIHFIKRPCLRSDHVHVTVALPALRLLQPLFPENGYGTFC